MGESIPHAVAMAIARTPLSSIHPSVVALQATILPDSNFDEQLSALAGVSGRNIKVHVGIPAFPDEDEAQVDQLPPDECGRWDVERGVVTHPDYFAPVTMVYSRASPQVLVTRDQNLDISVWVPVLPSCAHGVTSPALDTFCLSEP